MLCSAAPVEDENGHKKAISEDTRRRLLFCRPTINWMISREVSSVDGHLEAHRGDAEVESSECTPPPPVCKGKRFFAISAFVDHQFPAFFIIFKLPLSKLVKIGCFSSLFLEHTIEMAGWLDDLEQLQFSVFIHRSIELWTTAVNFIAFGFYF